jgi:hypothetical protein
MSTDPTPTNTETVTIDADAAIELSEMLDFIADWLTSAPRMISCDFERFVGADGYTIDELKVTLGRWSNRLLALPLDPVRR